MPDSYFFFHVQTQTNLFFCWDWSPNIVNKLTLIIFCLWNSEKAVYSSLHLYDLGVINGDKMYSFLDCGSERYIIAALWFWRTIISDQLIVMQILSVTQVMPFHWISLIVYNTMPSDASNEHRASRCSQWTKKLCIILKWVIEYVLFDTSNDKITNGIKVN